jgi:hypothetical protein
MLVTWKERKWKRALRREEGRRGGVCMLKLTLKLTLKRRTWRTECGERKEEQRLLEGGWKRQRASQDIRFLKELKAGCGKGPVEKDLEYRERPRRNSNRGNVESQIAARRTRCKQRAQSRSERRQALDLSYAFT